MAGQLEEMMIHLSTQMPVGTMAVAAASSPGPSDQQADLQQNLENSY